MERLVNERLTWWTEKNQIIHKTHRRFRKGRTCAENLFDLKTFIDENGENKCRTLAAFLDVSAAYDNVLGHICINKLKEYKCPKKITGFVQKWFQEREVEFITGTGDKIYRKVWKGLPQGAVLSPVLYSIYTRDIVSEIKEGVQVRQFADDIAIYTDMKDTEKAKEKIEKSVETVMNKLRQLGLDLQPEKTALIEFGKPEGKRKRIQLKIKDTIIESQKEATFLGILMDEEGNMEGQANRVKKRVLMANRVIKMCNKVNTGMDVNTAIMYKSLVRSVMDYAVFIYYPRVKKTAYKIEQAQYAGIEQQWGTETASRQM